MRRLLWIATFIGLLVLPRYASAQVALTTTAHSSCTQATCATGGTTLTYAIDVGSGSNRQLAVFAFIGCGGVEVAPTITGVTYAGTSLTSIISNVSPASSRRGYLFAWPTGSQPTSGLNNVVVTLSADLNLTCNGGTRTLHSGAFAVTGVDQSTTFASTNSSTGAGASATLTLAGSSANDLGVNSLCAGDGITSSTETEQWQVDDTNSSCNSEGGATSTGTDNSLSWSIPSDSWIMLGGKFLAAGGGGGGGSPKRLLLLGCCEAKR